MRSKSIGAPESNSESADDDDGTGSAGGGGAASGPRKSMRQKASMSPKGNNLEAGSARSMRERVRESWGVCGMTEIHPTHFLP